MALPRLAIVGRPNVGKSSLMNMLARARVSIVDPTPGVTRDRVSTVIELDPPDQIGEGKLIEITDTGGYGVYTEAGKQFTDIGEDLGRLTHDIESQIAEAIESADLILFVIDAQTGITPLDEKMARLLRERGAGRRILLVANKVDSENWEQYAYEATSLGFGPPLMVSAAHSYLRRRFLEALFEAIPRVSDEDRADEENLIKIAIIGKRNAGKSTLVNSLAGEKRVIVSDIAGTTRDAIDVRIEKDGITFLAIDTAGVRKRKSLAGDVEWYALHRALRAIRRADVVLFLLDAATEVSQVDKHLSKEIQQQFKPCLIVVNKWDVVEGRNATAKNPVSTDDYLAYLDKELVGLDFAPIAFVSAQEEEGLNEMLGTTFALYRQSQQRVSTSRLNEVLERIMSDRGPSSRLGKVAKLYYASQVSVAPPTIALMVNDPQHFSPNYRRYLLNALRTRLPYGEIPIQLVFRARKRAELADIKSGEYRKAKKSGEGRAGKRKGGAQAKAAAQGRADAAGKGEKLIPGRLIRRGGQRAIEAPPLTDDELRALDETGEE